jgi:hypothetical protein
MRCAPVLYLSRANTLEEYDELCARDDEAHFDEQVAVVCTCVRDFLGSISLLAGKNDRAPGKFFRR